MSTPIEIKVILKDDERTLTQQFLCYEGLVNEDMISQYVTQAKKNFSGNTESIVVRLTMVIE
jgi:hypothetical protein